MHPPYFTARRKSPANGYGDHKHGNKIISDSYQHIAFGEIFAFIATYDNDIFKKRVTFVEYIF